MIKKKASWLPVLYLALTIPFLSIAQENANEEIAPPENPTPSQKHKLPPVKVNGTYNKIAKSIVPIKNNLSPSHNNDKLPKPSIPFGKLVAIKSNANNLFLKTDLKKPESPLTANAPNIESAEKFKIIDLGNGKVSLQLASNNKYVQPSFTIGKNHVVGSGLTPGNWESMVWESIEENKMALMASNRLWLQIDANEQNAPIYTREKTTNGLTSFSYILLDELEQYKEALRPIPELQHSLVLSVFPNPVLNQQFKIKFGQPKQEKVNISLYNTHGALIFTDNTDTFQNDLYTVDITDYNLVKGEYHLLKIYTESDVYTYKIVFK